MTIMLGIILLCNLDIPTLQAQASDSTQVDSDSTGIQVVVPLSFDTSVSDRNPLFSISDSTARWYKFASLAEYLGEEYPIFYPQREGFSRQQVFFIQGRPFSQAGVYVDGIDVASTLTGTVQQNSLPLMRLDHTSYISGLHRLNLNTKNYYFLIPRTEIDVDQSSYEFTSISGNLILPITKTWSTEWGYWNKDYRGEYFRGALTGNQAFGRVRYQADSTTRYLVDYHYDLLRNQEPFGYVVDDMNAFGFNRFTAAAINGDAYSSYRNHRLRVEYRQKSDPYNIQIAALLNKSRYFLNASSDSANTINGKLYARADSTFITSYDTGAMLLTGVTWDPFEITLRTQPMVTTITADRYSRSEVSNLYRLPVEASTSLSFDHFSLKVDAELTASSTGIEQRLSPSADLNVGPFDLQAYADISLNQQAPQSRWWRSPNFSGQELPGVINTHLGGTLSLNAFGKHKLSVDYAPRTHQMGMNSNQVFSWMQVNQQVSGEYLYEHDLKLFEWQIFSSATFNRSEQIGGQERFNNLIQRNRLRLAYKDYFFDRATFVKMSVTGSLLPFSHRTPRYYPQFNRHLSNFEWDEVPGYYRVDAEISARIRQMFVYIKFENVQQGTLTNGHFEMANHPMFSYRIRYGLKVIFLN